MQGPISALSWSKAILILCFDVSYLVIVFWNLQKLTSQNTFTSSTLIPLCIPAGKEHFHSGRFCSRIKTALRIQFVGMLLLAPLGGSHLQFDSLPRGLLSKSRSGLALAEGVVRLWRWWGHVAINNAWPTDTNHSSGFSLQPNSPCPHKPQNLSSITKLKTLTLIWK